MGSSAVMLLVSAVRLPLLICLPLLSTCLGTDENLNLSFDCISLHDYSSNK